MPKIASGNRLAATPEEYAGIMRGTIAQFGTYTVDEDKQTFTMKFTASTFPNWEGSLQTRSVDKLTDEEFINTNPQVGAGPRLGVQLVPAGEVMRTSDASRQWSPRSGGTDCVWRTR